MMSSLRIMLSIHHELDPDTGAPGATIALGKRLRRLGQDVELLSFDDMPLRLPYRLAALLYSPFVAMRLARRGAEIDVVDASTGDLSAWAMLRRLVGRRSRQPLLVTRSHGLEHLFHEATVGQAKIDGRRLSRRYHLYWGGLRLREVRRSLQAADLVLVLNERERSYAIDRLGIPPERLRLTANGVPQWFLDASRPAASPPARVLIAQVGEHREMKGVACAAAALTRVMQERDGVGATFIGSRVGRERVLRSFPAELHDRISVVERYRREELPGLLRDQSIVLFPSLSEGFSMALLESMACGLVPVASDISSVRRLVEPEQNGLLIPPGETEALAAALLRTIDEPRLLRRLRLAARATAEDYSWEHIAAQTLDLYREMLGRRADG